MTHSARKQKHYILTESAERDFREARRWSRSRWGDKLTRQYFSDLNSCAENLAANPQRMSPLEQDLDVAELKIFPVREHYLVYVPVQPDLIVIVALIRQTRDVPAILNANSFLIRRQLNEIPKIGSD